VPQHQRTKKCSNAFRPPLATMQARNCRPLYVTRIDEDGASPDLRKPYLESKSFCLSLSMKMNTNKVTQFGDQVAFAQNGKQSIVYFINRFFL